MKQKVARWALFRRLLRECNVGQTEKNHRSGETLRNHPIAVGTDHRDGPAVRPYQKKVIWIIQIFDPLNPD